MVAGASIDGHSAHDVMRGHLAAVAERVLAFVRANMRARQAPLQHVLMAGLPGAGTSVALGLVAEGIGRMSGDPPLVITFSRIDCATMTPETLLQRPAAILTKADPAEGGYFWRGGGDQEWHAALRILDGAIADHAGMSGRLLVLLVDGIDLLLDRGAAGDAAQSRIRDLLQHHDRIMLVASANSTETQNDPDRRIFQAFAPIRLPVIGSDAMMARLDGEAAGVRAGAAAAAVLFAQTPDHIRSFLRLAQLAPDLPVRAQYHALADIGSGALLRQLDTLPIRSRRFMDALIRGGEPARPTEIAARLDTASSDIGQTTKELLSAEMIALHPGSTTRNRQYYCRDRLMADCYRKAAGDSGFDLADVLAVLSAHLLSASGRPPGPWREVVGDVTGINAALHEKGRPAGYQYAAERISADRKDLVAYLDAFTAQLVGAPLADAHLQHDLADLADVLTVRNTHGALLRAAIADAHAERPDPIATDLEPVLRLIRHQSG